MFNTTLGFIDEDIKNKLCIVFFSLNEALLCKPVKVTLELLEHDYKQSITFYELNVNNNVLVNTKYSIYFFPTVLAFKGGEIVGQIIGPKSKQRFIEMCELLLKEQQ